MCRFAQAEIERTMKKVDEGIVMFDDIWKKVRLSSLSRPRGEPRATVGTLLGGSVRESERERGPG